MFKNYFITAFRSLGRRKGHAFLNITGLAVGFAAFLLIFLVVNFGLVFYAAMAAAISFPYWFGALVLPRHYGRVGAHRMDNGRVYGYARGSHQPDREPSR